MEEKKNIFSRLRNYLKDARGEMKKVSWPNRYDLSKTTIAVVVASFFFGIYLFVVDFVFTRLIKQVMTLFIKK